MRESARGSETDGGDVGARVAEAAGEEERRGEDEREELERCLVIWLDLIVLSVVVGLSGVSIQAKASANTWV